MTLVDTNKAVDFFMAKLEFTTGPVELKGWMDTNENINIIDVRYPVDFAAGHIPGSINLPKDRWGTFEGLRGDKVNIIYCYSTVCHMAASASLYFAEHGYHVMELDGGFDQWKKHEFPIET